ncbi:uncharacterized protein LOC133807148 isoform X1 [Humulus lupulus]|uniref:uncharacterized protein LOC133807148 isoform X1 n=1 Tax=Humulus lupulus TaxID=3486 RepID=UPI002B40FC0D|nr:uncharacterized protein LOC133807148 isoform X1 [Humulus lupulus]
MVKDEWMRAAMSDDTLVVELLVRLKQSQAASPLKSHPQLPTMFPLTWTVRLPRSRALRCDGAVSQRKQADSTRCSPTTPLSWSGGASPSATADGFEESSRPANRSPSHSRSKGTATNNELGSNTSSSRRSRRKKTFAELKEEESSLLKERVYLRKELTKLRATFKEQRSTNESLKRIKLEFGENSAKYVDADGPLKRAISTRPHQIIASTFGDVSSNLPIKVIDHDHPRSDSSDASKAVLDRDSFYFLPDLNSVPNEPNDEDLCMDMFSRS